jgi:hypothetical protein
MPLSGTADVTVAAGRAPRLRDLDSERWELPGADLLQVSCEVAEEASLALLPPALHPSIPPYATFSFERCPQSPVGPFSLAQVRLVARSGVRPRGYLLQAWTDSKAAAEELAARWGFTVELAEVDLDARHDVVSGRVIRRGHVILHAELEMPEAISGSDLSYQSSLHLCRFEDAGAENPVLVQVDPEYTFHRAERGRPHLRSFAPDAFPEATRLVPRDPIIASFVRVDTDLPRIRFVFDPTVAGGGGMRKLAAA